MSCVPWILPSTLDFEIDEFHEFKDAGNVFVSSKTLERQRMEDARMHLSAKKEVPFSKILEELASTCALHPNEALFLNDSPGMYASFFVPRLKKWMGTRSSDQPLFAKSLRFDDDGILTIDLSVDASRDTLRRSVHKRFKNGVSFITSNAHNEDSLYDAQVECMKHDVFTAIDLQCKGGTFLCRIPRPVCTMHLQILSILCKEYEFVSLLSPKVAQCSQVYVCAQEKRKAFDASTCSHQVYKQYAHSLLDAHWVSKVSNVLDILEEARIQALA
jgi:hypothetical protein